MRPSATWARVGLGVAALIVAGSARWPLSPARVGNELDAAFGPASRLHWRAPQAASLSLLPWPHLRVLDARLADGGGVELVIAPEARLQLALGALLAGRMKPVAATLRRPILTLDLDRIPFAGAPESPATGAAGGLAPLTRIDLADGVLRLHSGRLSLDTLVEDLRGSIDGLAVGARLDVDLHGTWRQTPVALSLAASDPEAAARGVATPFSLSLTARGVSASLGGTFVGGAEPALDGKAHADVRSIRDLSALVGGTRPFIPAADDLRLDGRLTATPTRLTLAEANLASGGQTVEGALELVASEGHPTLSGSLAADALALAPILGPAPGLFGPNGAWSAATFGFSPPKTFALDLRLSAARLDVWGHAFADVAGSLWARDGVATATLNDATAYSGRLAGEARIESASADLRTRARVDLTDADLGAAFADFGWPAFSGRGALRIALETHGDSFATAIGSVGGTISVSAADGGIAGVSLEEAMRKSQRHKLDPARDMRFGDTAFDRLSIALALDRGVAHVASGALSARGLAATLNGDVDIAARAWRASIEAIQTDASGAPSTDAAHLKLTVKGPWIAPEVSAD